MPKEAVARPESEFIRCNQCGGDFWILLQEHKFTVKGDLKSGKQNRYNTGPVLEGMEGKFCPMCGESLVCSDCGKPYTECRCEIDG